MLKGLLISSMLLFSTAASAGQFDVPPSSLEKNLEGGLDALRQKNPDIQSEPQHCSRSAKGNVCMMVISGYVVSAEGTELPPRTASIMFFADEKQPSNSNMVHAIIPVMAFYDPRIFDRPEVMEKIWAMLRSQSNKTQSIRGVDARYTNRVGKMKIGNRTHPIEAFYIEPLR